jgi:hypothetical protein
MKFVTEEDIVRQSERMGRRRVMRELLTIGLVVAFLLGVYFLGLWMEAYTRH